MALNLVRIIIIIVHCEDYLNVFCCDHGYALLYVLSNGLSHYVKWPTTVTVSSIFILRTTYTYTMFVVTFDEFLIKIKRLLAIFGHWIVVKLYRVFRKTFN